MIENGKKYLITTYDWFYGPDGESYKGVWGRCELLKAEELLGFRPTHATNWVIRLGVEDVQIVIGGCQINYAVRTDTPPRCTANILVLQ